MKRSTQIALAAAGVVLVASFWPGGEEDREDLVYNGLDECRKDGRLSAQQCETAFSEATAARLRDAPKFASQRECEAQYGASGCSSASIGGTNYFIPALAGFMLARGLSGGAQPLMPPTTAACPPGSANPECQQARAATSSSSSSSSGGSSGGGARRYSTSGGRSIAAVPTAARAASGVSTTSRGGFGSTAKSYSSHASS
ncbi:MAG: hypothetical protein DI527_13525 [Chelatococcus sp.]|nr:MAG: hypothetical protein DI527_13525 [Chelatococcus sp.]